MQDIVFPNNNELQIIDMAKKLDLESLILVYPFQKYSAEIKDKFLKNSNIKIGLLCSEKQIKQAKNITNFVFVEKSQNFQRIVEKNKEIILIGLEKQEERDFIHHRASGLNHVLCSLIKKNNISVAFSFNSTLSSDKKNMIIGKMKQNMRLCKKYKIKMIFASFASESYEMRNYIDIKSFFNTL